MVKLVVGLGNVGNEYTHTRHNAGFLALDLVSRKMSFDWEAAANGWGELVRDKNRNVWLFKPGCYMNRSGEAVVGLVNYYKLEWKDVQLSVVHDELDLNLGEIKTAYGGGSAGHRGVASLRMIGDMDWDGVRRWRLGVGRPAPGVTDSETISRWVLSTVASEQKGEWEGMLERCAELVIEDMG